MKCPHCLDSFHDAWSVLYLSPQGQTEIDDSDGKWAVVHTACPSCHRSIIKLRNRTADGATTTEAIVRPRAPSRAPLSPDVPSSFADDYREACLVLSDSPKASAALSRRCLQHLLRYHFTIKPSNLSDEIDEVMAKLPGYLAQAVDAIRTIGNFAAHPMKSTNTGELLDVEPGEAEWCLDVLERMFDFCFIQPAVIQQKRDALNQKLSDAGKPPLKAP